MEYDMTICYLWMQAMPLLTDRSKLPNIVDPVIKDTMDLKHLYQVSFLIQTFLGVLGFYRDFQFTGFLNLVGCCSSCAMRATRAELPSANHRCSSLACSSCSGWARRNTQGSTSHTACLSCWSASALCEIRLLTVAGYVCVRKQDMNFDHEASTPVGMLQRRENNKRWWRSLFPSHAKSQLSSHAETNVNKKLISL